MITLAPSDHARERQPHLFGTTEWDNGYYRRNCIESANSEIKQHRATIGRDYIRVFGTTKTAFLILHTLVGVNIDIIRTWHAKQGLPDPWAVELGEKTCLPTRLRRRQARHTEDVRDYAPAGTPPDP